MDQEEILALSAVVPEIPSLFLQDKPMLRQDKRNKNTISLSTQLLGHTRLKDLSHPNGSMDLEEILVLPALVPEILSLSLPDKPMLSKNKKNKNFVSVSTPLMDKIDMPNILQLKSTE